MGVKHKIGSTRTLQTAVLVCAYLEKRSDHVGIRLSWYTTEPTQENGFWVCDAPWDIGTMSKIDQNTYIEILLADCGFSTRVMRNAYLSRLFGTEVNYIDDLNKAQKTLLINELKQRKVGTTQEKDDRDETDEDTTIYRKGR